MLRKRVVAGRTITAIVAGVVATVIGAWASYFIGPGQDPPPLHVVGEKEEPEESPTAEDVLAQSRISFSDWQALVKQAFDAEQRKAIFERYRGERVTWQGYVDKVNRITPDNGASSSAQFILVLYEDKQTLESTALGRAPALCIFPLEAERLLAEIDHGQRVIIQGTFAAASLHGQLLGTRLYNCKLIDAH